MKKDHWLFTERKKEFCKSISLKSIITLFLQNSTNFLTPQNNAVGMYIKLYTQLENEKKIKLGNLDWKTPDH